MGMITRTRMFLVHDKKKVTECHKWQYLVPVVSVLSAINILH